MKDRFDTKEEVIVGYRVSEARKKLWVTELDLLEDLEKVCKKNDINFFLLFIKNSCFNGACFYTFR